MIVPISKAKLMVSVATPQTSSNMILGVPMEMEVNARMTSGTMLM